MANNVVTLKMIENLEQRLNMCSSLESLVPATADDGIESLPCMADPSPTPEEALLQQEEHDDVKETMRKAVTPREYQVLSYRYGFETGYPMSLQEVGIRMGLTRERIRQLEERGIRRLRAYYRNRAQTEEQEAKQAEQSAREELATHYVPVIVEDELHVRRLTKEEFLQIRHLRQKLTMKRRRYMNNGSYPDYDLCCKLWAYVHSSAFTPDEQRFITLRYNFGTEEYRKKVSYTTIARIMRKYTPEVRQIEASADEKVTAWLIKHERSNK